MSPARQGGAQAHQSAFLFADLVGFTAYTEAHGDEAAADLAAAFCDRVCALNHGHDAEDVKTLGDACMIYAPDAADAIALALEIVTTIGPENQLPRVRVGIDYGSAARRNDDWFGTTVNRASRIVALAAEGTALATEHAKAAAGAMPGVEFLPRGEASLKGLSQPVRLFELRRAA